MSVRASFFLLLALVGCVSCRDNPRLVECIPVEDGARLANDKILTGQIYLLAPTGPLRVDGAILRAGGPALQVQRCRLDSYIFWNGSGEYWYMRERDSVADPWRERPIALSEGGDFANRAPSGLLDTPHNVFSLECLREDSKRIELSFRAAVQVKYLEGEVEEVHLAEARKTREFWQCVHDFNLTMVEEMEDTVRANQSMGSPEELAR